MNRLFRKLLWVAVVSVAFSVQGALLAQSDSETGEPPVATTKTCAQSCKKEACGACTPSAEIPDGLTFEVGCDESCQQEGECKACCFTIEVMASGQPPGGPPAKVIKLCRVNGNGCVAGTEVSDSSGLLVMEEDITLPCTEDAESSTCIQVTVSSTKTILLDPHWRYTACAKMSCGFCQEN